MADENQFDEVTHETNELENALASLTPKAAAIDRDRLLFLAGQASVQRVRHDSAVSRWAWPMATCVSTVVALFLAIMLIDRIGVIDELHAREATARQEPRPPVDDNANALKMFDKMTVSNETRDPSNPKGDSESTPIRRPEWQWSSTDLAEQPNYLRLRSFILAFGPNAWPDRENSNVRPATARPADAPRTQHELMEELLNSESRLERKRS